DGQVLLAVAVEVPHRHGDRPLPDAVVDGGGEGAVALAQQHADGAAAEGGSGQVWLAGAVEGAPRHGERPLRHAVVDGAGEGAVALAQQHADGVAARVGKGQVLVRHGQVLFAVAVEVSYRHGGRIGPDGGGVGGGGEGAVALAQQHAYGAA